MRAWRVPAVSPTACQQPHPRKTNDFGCVDLCRRGRCDCGTIGPRRALGQSHSPTVPQSTCFATSRQHLQDLKTQSSFCTSESVHLSPGTGGGAPAAAADRMQHRDATCGGKNG